MSLLLQNLVVLLLVGGCLGYAGWQLFQTFHGRKSRIGSCCAKGCPTTHAEAEARAKAKAEQIIFLPVEMLIRRK